jgi:hypothetical protein
MKNLIARILDRKQTEILAAFGSARLIVKCDGTLEIQGGSPTERGEAREWLSLFAHGAVLGRNRTLHDC